MGDPASQWDLSHLFACWAGLFVWCFGVASSKACSWTRRPHHYLPPTTNQVTFGETNQAPRLRTLWASLRACRDWELEWGRTYPRETVLAILFPLPSLGFR
ncbi:hypothetical protein BX600DRAFT_456903 [Xylariales sp. PMI_506]|nr:hypothetical protein BX600DRAFT_456903 [Xylariales sp. PMI_506]